ncbi:hypothetical protein KTT_32760 [Tengunoibacter tsumagoiensis]|uniref:Uncharacterized protein n=1 Tax=Tengunoibacter tsumagoiensis TaxID=2014871 RepID=A0A402A2P5_9CHLR|nr:hypothetical protein KTT_32760 [Tengunoibacter tsumagoiensis]
MSLPAIWDSGRNQHSETCDVIVTDQRVLGYYYRNFPRERLFLDSIPLAGITSVTFREKEFSPVFRELLIANAERRVYIRAPKQKAQQLYATIRSAIESYTSHTVPPSPSSHKIEAEDAGQSQTLVPPVYQRQTLRQQFENSPLAISILFTGGLFLEVLGAIVLATTRSAPTGLPLIFAGLVAVTVAFLLRRQKN